MTQDAENGLARKQHELAQVQFAFAPHIRAAVVMEL
jgi:hypothetical protein